MPKRSDDPDDIILTDEEAARMRPALEVMPAATAAAYRRRRGKQKTPTKLMVSLRMDREVVEAYRATGRGWQSRVNDLLAKHAPKVRAARTRRSAEP